MDTATTGMITEPTVFAYTTADVGRIYSGLDGDASFLKVPSVSNLRRNYEYETKRLCTLELHLITLAEYHKSNRIPRGMRSQLKPNLFFTDTDFKARYEQISNKYALDLILLNIEHLQRENPTAEM